jgi:SAM-dependent methyltransferase
LSTVQTASASYAERVRVFSDIQRHLPRLRRAGRGTVLELGVRSGNSTAALLAGVERHGGAVWSVDVDPTCAETFRGHPQWHFVCADSRDKDTIREAGFPQQLDVLFIDTLHEYEQTRSELALWGPSVRPGGRILLHDVEVAAGVWRAVREYCNTHRLPYRLAHGSNGLGVVYVGGGVLQRGFLAAFRPLAMLAAAARRGASRVGPIRRAVTGMRGHA